MSTIDREEQQLREAVFAGAHDEIPRTSAHLRSMVGTSVIVTGPGNLHIEGVLNSILHDHEGRSDAVYLVNIGGEPACSAVVYLDKISAVIRLADNQEGNTR